jgi:DNA N-6-adenine-methyltransferase (Dam)
MKYRTNPQAMALVAQRLAFGGNPLLSSAVDGDTWMTPRFILGQLGKFDLDPCAAELKPHWIAKTSYTIADDGLAAGWTGRVFMNPPFSNTGPWLRKHADHACGISLVPASVESVVWREVVWKRAHAVLLLHGRTRFCNPDGSSTTGRPLRSIALLAWSDHDATILEASSLAGVLLKDWHQR